MTHFSKVIVKKIRQNFLEMRSAVSAINSGWDRREYDHNLRGRGEGEVGEGGGVLWSYDTGRFDTSREALPHWEQS